MIKRLIYFFYDFLVEVIDKEVIMFDVIMGNGNDIVFLVKSFKKVYVFDI